MRGLIGKQAIHRIVRIVIQQISFILIPLIALSLHQDTIPVDPPAGDPLDIVVNHKTIRRGYQLKIADIRKQIGLHYSNFIHALHHSEPSLTPATFR